MEVCGFVADHDRDGAAPEPATPMKFYFGEGEPKAGFTAVAAGTKYSDVSGFGFEPGPENPKYFSVKLPEGNYACTVTLGDSSHDATTTIKAELRRLMLEKIQTKAGESVTKSFTVNVRTPAIAGGIMCI